MLCPLRAFCGWGYLRVRAWGPQAVQISLGLCAHG
jgi:hypothetical protein